MAELAIGLVGAGATIGAGVLTTGSGFAGRHENSLREEIMDTKQSTADFMTNLQSGDITKDEEIEFLKTREKAIQMEEEYYESIESYKGASWLSAALKFKKKKEVRIKKRLTRKYNHSLRSLNESMHSGSDTSSTCASSGSPPGSNLAADDIQDWAEDVANHRTASGDLASDVNARDIKIDSYTLSFHDHLLIDAAEITLSYGQRYGLVGENGSGKSTFLQSIAARDIEIPQHLDIYLVSEGVEPSDMNPVDLLVAYATKQKAAILEALKNMCSSPDVDELALKVAFERFKELVPTTFQVEARSILHGLGFSPKTMETPTRDMSVTERKHVALACGLFVKPHVLLLDEPTEHLYPSAVAWLEGHLRTYHHILVATSDCGDFLDKICTDIIHLTNKKVIYYTGNYSTFLRTQRENEAKAFQIRQLQQEPNHLPKFQQILDPVTAEHHRFLLDLSQCLLDFVIELLPTQEEMAVNENVRKLLERLIRTIEPDSRLLAFGSTANGFSLRNSDMDLCCLIEGSDQPPSATALVTMLGDLLERETKFHVKPLPHARIPIVKLTLDPSPGLPLGIACDIGFENRLALENTRLLRCYAMFDPTRVRTMVLILKVWSKRRKINSPYKGTLSSYGYVLLVIYFLVHVKNPPVLPNLQQMPPLRPITKEDTHVAGYNTWFFDDIELLRTRWHSENNESVAELLIDFFRYYARDFSYNTGVASIRAGLLKKSTKGWQNDLSASKYDSRERNRLCIEDPFELDFNVGSCVTKDGSYTIRGEFMRASRILSNRPERAVVALAELCAERIDEDLVSPLVSRRQTLQTK
ncbi:hypothetical protein FB451DRAFT_1325416 [Mycena latifolia]|nr:hypothetical protein FB451DRAFT_1325416 [Mycena latifolia]